MMRRPRFLGAFALASVLSTPVAAAADATPQDRAAARALFDDGRKLAREGKYGEACPKLEESERLDAGMGTLFNLADCYEHLGRTASAWSDFLEVADSAKRSGEVDRERVARARAEALAARLARVTFVRQDSSIRAQVKLDGSLLGEGAVGAGLPVDPGTHTIEASAPGKKPWTSEIEIREGQTAMVTVPPLQDEVVAPAPPPAASIPSLLMAPKTQPEPQEPRQETARSWQRPLGIGLSATGVVGLGIGTFFALQAQSKWSDAKPLCPGGICSPTAYSGWSDARNSATASTVAFVAGGIVLGAGVVLWITAPASMSARVGVTSNRATLDVEF
jgi:hypothetical protein